MGKVFARSPPCDSHRLPRRPIDINKHLSFCLWRRGELEKIGWERRKEKKRGKNGRVARPSGALRGGKVLIFFPPQPSGLFPEQSVRSAVKGHSLLRTRVSERDRISDSFSSGVHCDMGRLSLRSCNELARAGRDWFLSGPNILWKEWWKETNWVMSGGNFWGQNEWSSSVFTRQSSFCVD